MKFHKQLFRHKPEEGIYGDCFRTAVACLVGIEPDAVPHEHRDLRANEQCEIMDAWLERQGLNRIKVALSLPTVEAALEHAEYFSGGLPFMLTGTSRNGTNHVVIAQGRAIVHDPALDDSGLVGPGDDGYFWVEWIVRAADAA